MIRGFINAHPRSGSTFFQKLIVYSNKDIPVLHQPGRPLLIEDIRNHLGGKVNPMHRWAIHEGYERLSKKCFNEFEENREGSFFYSQENSLFSTLNPLHGCSQEIMFKAITMHLFLNKIAEKYDCNYIHMVRNPVNNFVSAFPGKFRNEKGFKKVANGGYKPDEIVFPFGEKRFYEVSSNEMDVKTHESDWIGMHLIGWAYANNEAVKQAKKSERGLVIRFEDLMNKPVSTFKLISKHLDIEMNIDLIEDFDLNRGMRPLPDYLFEAFDKKATVLGIKEKCNDLIKYFPECFSRT